MNEIVLLDVNATHGSNAELGQAKRLEKQIQDVESKYLVDDKITKQQ